MATKDSKPFEGFDSFEQFFEQAETRVGYWEERAKLEFTREIVERMDEYKVSKSELASRLEVSPGFVTRLLSGRNNFEIATMVRLAMALDCRFHGHLHPKGSICQWIDILESPENMTPIVALNAWRGLEHSYSTVQMLPQKDVHSEDLTAAA